MGKHRSPGPPGWAVKLKEVLDRARTPAQLARLRTVFQPERGVASGYSGASVYARDEPRVVREAPAEPGPPSEPPPEAETELAFDRDSLDDVTSLGEFSLVSSVASLNTVDGHGLRFRRDPPPSPRSSKDVEVRLPEIEPRRAPAVPPVDLKTSTEQAVAGAARARSAEKSRRRGARGSRDPPGSSRQQYSRRRGRSRSAPTRHSMEDSPVIQRGTAAVPDWALRLPSPHVGQLGDIFLDSARGILEFFAEDRTVSRPQTSGAPLRDLSKLPRASADGFYHAPPTARSLASSQSLRSLTSSSQSLRSLASKKKKPAASPARMTSRSFG
jgi:hypothetical protein